MTRSHERSKEILNEAIDGLVEYYPQLRDTDVLLNINRWVDVPDTGDDQADYLATRDQIEKCL